MNKLYNFSIKNESIGSIFTITKNINSTYCFDFLLIVKNNFNLNEFIKLDFNIFKIISVDELFITGVNFNEVKKLHNYLESPFKDNFVSYEESKKPDELFLLSKESIDYENHCDLINNFVLENNTILKEMSFEKKN